MYFVAGRSSYNAQCKMVLNVVKGENDNNLLV